ncbi:EamA family transporter [Alkalibacterium sp. AK22]|uniref:EamA family transporter n=1 Tax=Alkalibacterium sp. AK22 TaxID=1229520 RepID=UPI0004B25C5D|nr:EamA family transporter [Alkalibacterium sp. AK22]
MIYLFLAVLCSASIGLIFKYTETSNTNRYVITSANYFIAFMTSLLMIMSQGLLTGVRREAAFTEELGWMLESDQYLLSPFSSIIWGVSVGALAGVFFFLSFIFYQKSVRDNGVGISGTFGKLGILIPMIFSILIWREYPTSIQWIGIGLSLISIVVVNLSKQSIRKFDFKPTVLLLFVFGGMAEFSNKIYQQYALNDYKDIFLFTIFFVAFVISIIYVANKKVKVTKKDILTGFMVGIPNLFSSYFLIMSLETVRTSVAFPVYSAGSIVLINLGGLLIYRETLARKNQLAIALTVIALILINA